MERTARRRSASLDDHVSDIVELARQLTWSQTRADLSHCRTKDGVEVDIVLENRRGATVTIEVKASATARTEHFRGIDHLAARLGDDLVAGIVLYLDQHTLSFGARKIVLPVSAVGTGCSRAEERRARQPLQSRRSNADLSQRRSSRLLMRAMRTPSSYRYTSTAARASIGPRRQLT